MSSPVFRKDSRDTIFNISCPCQYDMISKHILNYWLNLVNSCIQGGKQRIYSILILSYSKWQHLSALLPF